jgi:hypothetical protein
MVALSKYSFLLITLRSSLSAIAWLALLRKFMKLNGTQWFWWCAMGGCDDDDADGWCMDGGNWIDGITGTGLRIQKG